MGATLYVVAENLRDEDFMFLNAGESTTQVLALSTNFNMTTRGEFTVAARGAIPYADAVSNELIGALKYEMKNVTVHISNDDILYTPLATRISKRSVVASNCQTGATVAALGNCRVLALTGARAAREGSENRYFSLSVYISNLYFLPRILSRCTLLIIKRFAAYFKTVEGSAREAVAARLESVADECASSTSGRTRTACLDLLGNYCIPSIAAYTFTMQGIIVNCPTFFAMPAFSRSCNALSDQASTTLHEMTHAQVVFTPKTGDYAYGNRASLALDSSQALCNADTFSIFAQSRLSGPCRFSSSKCDC